MKIEVGKTYKDREGNVVTIVSKGSSFHPHPYLGDNGSSYMEDGRYRDYDKYHDYDLVEEVPAIGMFGSTWTFNNLKEEPKQEEEPMQDQIVTLNCTLTVTTAYGEPRLEIYPKDEAWRASSVCTVLDDNFELVLPRSKIEELYTDKLLVKVKKADEDFKLALAELEAANNFLDSL